MAYAGRRDDKPLLFSFAMSFQPIVDVTTNQIWG